MKTKLKLYVSAYSFDKLFETYVNRMLDTCGLSTVERRRIKSQLNERKLGNVG